MLRWEAFLDDCASDMRLLALCQYSVPALDRDVIMDAFRTHSYCVMGKVVVPHPFHEAPETVQQELVTDE
ncbi:MAG: hypothetical protein ABEL97_09665 [Salinibacter sp.]